MNSKMMLMSFWRHCRENFEKERGCFIPLGLLSFLKHNTWPQWLNTTTLWLRLRELSTTSSLPPTPLSCSTTLASRSPYDSLSLRACQCTHFFLHLSLWTFPVPQLDQRPEGCWHPRCCFLPLALRQGPRCLWHRLHHPELWLWYLSFFAFVASWHFSVFAWNSFYCLNSWCCCSCRCRCCSCWRGQGRGEEGGEERREGRGRRSRPRSGPLRLSWLVARTVNETIISFPRRLSTFCFHVAKRARGAGWAGQSLFFIFVDLFLF